MTGRFAICVGIFAWLWGTWGTEPFAQNQAWAYNPKPTLQRSQPSQQSKQLQQYVIQLKLPSRNHRVSAARALSRLKEDALPALPQLLITLKDPYPEVRGAIAFTIGSIGPKAYQAIPALLAALEDPHPWVRGFATFALARMGPRAHAALFQRLTHAKNSVRYLAALGLARAGKKSPTIESILCHATDAKTTWMRFYALKALRVSRARHPKTIQAFLRALSDSKHRIRVEALRGVIGIGPAARGALPRLLVLRKAKDFRERTRAIRALGAIQVRSPQVIALLKQDYRDSLYLVRWAAYRSLHELGVKLPHPSLSHAYRSRRPLRPSPRPIKPSSQPTVRAVSRPSSQPTLRSPSPTR